MGQTDGQDSPDTAYTMGYTQEFLQLLERRSAQTCVAYLLPQLRPGLSVLDFGCGPGTISVGLAEAVHPGPLHGIDIEASQIEIAQAAALAGGHSNMVLQTGDVTEMPFEDDSFDVAHCHAVLTHLPDTQAVLAEVRRVLKPGGLLACRELINSSCFFEPGVDGLNSGWDTFRDLLAANGGHPQIGRQLKGAFREAGFADIRSGAEFEYFGSAEDIAFFHGFAIGWFCSEETVEAAVSLGVAERQAFDGWRLALDRWREDPGAAAAIGWGYALGRKP